MLAIKTAACINWIRPLSLEFFPKPYFQRIVTIWPGSFLRSFILRSCHYLTSLWIHSMQTVLSPSNLSKRITKNCLTLQLFEVVLPLRSKSDWQKILKEKIWQWDERRDILKALKCSWDFKKVMHRCSAVHKTRKKLEKVLIS